MGSFRHVPIWIAALFVFDVLLITAPVFDYLLGSPSAFVRNALHLDSDHSLPAWYSSVQWLAAGVLFGLLLMALKPATPGFVAMAGLALLCVAFSADEIVGVHEWLGRQSDALLPDGDRTNIALWRTGIWPLLIGIPVLGIMVAVILQLRRIFARAPRAFRLLVIGLALLFTGALAVELTVNLITTPEETPGLVLLQLVIEEGLEMLGGTLIVWSAYESLLAYGFALHVPNAVVPASAAGQVGTPIQEASEHYRTARMRGSD